MSNLLVGRSRADRLLDACFIEIGQQAPKKDTKVQHVEALKIDASKVLSVAETSSTGKEEVRKERTEKADPENVLKRLSAVLDSKPKFSKGVTLFCKFAMEHTTVENYKSILDVCDKIATNENLYTERDTGNAEALRRLMDEVILPLRSGETTSFSEQEVIYLTRFLRPALVLRAQMLTDDSFALTKAANEVKTILQEAKDRAVSAMEAEEEEQGGKKKIKPVEENQTAAQQEEEEEGEVFPQSPSPSFLSLGSKQKSLVLQCVQALCGRSLVDSWVHPHALGLCQAAFSSRHLLGLTQEEVKRLVGWQSDLQRAKGEGKVAGSGGMNLAAVGGGVDVKEWRLDVGSGVGDWAKRHRTG